MTLIATACRGLQVYEHEKKKHRETDELRREEAQLQQETQRLRQVALDKDVQLPCNIVQYAWA